VAIRGQGVKKLIQTAVDIAQGKMRGKGPKIVYGRDVEQKAPFDGPIAIKVGNVSHTLEHKFASIINVRRS